MIVAEASRNRGGLFLREHRRRELILTTLSSSGWEFAPRFLTNLGVFVAAAVAVWTTQSAATVKPAPALRSNAELERSVIMRGDTVPVYILVRFEASGLDAARPVRPPLNLSLVLDRSGSM